MPLRPFCATPACLGRSAPRSRWCTTCGPLLRRQQDRTYKQAAPARRALYSSKAWRIVRRMVLVRDPICKLCGEQASTEADHITPLADGGAALDMGNLQGVDASCHSRKTREEIERRKHG
jgi:5-methylcytosine-specific restriction endonuclease McrA